ncbi:MAG: BTAD domain-containing putative transcriptional regulator [Pseudomonadota bacterium]
MSGLAKLTRPKLYKVLPRERLFARLDEGCAQGAVWVAGPPGAGKTALVASYLGERRVGGVWLHVDSGDNDPASFFYYLAQTVPVSASKAKTAPSLPVLTPEFARNLDVYARLFFRALYARMKQPAALVLDNYHELAADSPMHGVLTIARQEMPSGISLVVISRQAPPPIWLHQSFAWLDWEELRLTGDEMRAIAGLRGDYPEATLAALQNQTDGWAAGLTLALEQARRPGVSMQHLQLNTQELLFQFFAGQVFTQANVAIQQCLIRCALFPRFTAAMAAQITANADAEKIVEECYRRRLFVERRGEHYQFHDLFRAFLLEQLRQLPAEQTGPLQQHASQLLQQAGELDAAAQLLIQLADWPALAALIHRGGQQMLEAGRWLPLRKLLTHLPEQLIAAQPRLLLWFGLCDVPVQPVRARVPLQQAIDQFVERQDPIELAVALTGMVTTYQFEFSDLRPLDGLLAQLDMLLQADGDKLPPLVELRVRSTLLYALSFRQPDAIRTQDCVQRVLQLLAEPIPINHRLNASCHLMLHAWHSADLDLGRRVEALSTPMLNHPDVNTLNHALWWKELGNFELMCGDTGKATQAFLKARALWESQGISLPTLHFTTNAGLCVAAMVSHDLEAAERYRADNASYMQSASLMDQSVDVWLRAMLAARQENWLAARDFAEKAYRLNRQTGVLLQHFHCSMQLAIAQIDTGQFQQVEALTEEARAVITSTAFAHYAYLTDWILAYAAHRRGNETACHDYLRRALLTSRHDQGKLFLRLQAHMAATLCNEALRHNIESDTVVRMIRRCDLLPPEAAVANWPWPLAIRTFGNFELSCDGEVLTYGRKAPKKTLALLKALLAYGGQQVAEQQVIDALWPDEEGDAGARALTAALHRLRTLLSDNEVIIQQAGTLSLNRERVWCDVWEFERLLATGGARRAEAIALYHGSFLAEDTAEMWSVPMRERLRSKFVHVLAEHADALEKNGQHEQAIAMYLRGLDADNAIEPFYQGLMRCYAKLGRVPEAMNTFHKLKRILAVTLGIAPSADSERLFQQLKA